MLSRLEWDGARSTLLDANGDPVTSMKLRDLMFKREPTLPKTLRFRFKTDDERET